jgi:hypothetical protein
LRKFQTSGNDKMKLKKITWLAVGLIVLIVCIAVPVSAYGISNLNVASGTTIAPGASITGQWNWADFENNGLSSEITGGSWVSAPSEQNDPATFSAVAGLSGTVSITIVEGGSLSQTISYPIASETTSPTTEPTTSPTTEPTTSPGCTATYCYNLGDAISTHYFIDPRDGVSTIYDENLILSSSHYGEEGALETYGTGYGVVYSTIGTQECGSSEFPVGIYTSIFGSYDTGHTYQCINNGTFTDAGKDFYGIASNVVLESASPYPRYGAAPYLSSPFTTHVSVTCIGAGQSGGTGSYGASGEIVSGITAPGRQYQSIGIEAPNGEYSGVGQGIPVLTSSDQNGDTDFYVPTANQESDVLVVHADGAAIDAGSSGGIVFTPSNPDAECIIPILGLANVVNNGGHYDQRSCSAGVLSYNWGAGGAGGTWDSEEEEYTDPDPGNYGGCLVEFTSKPNYFFIGIKDKETDRFIQNASFVYADGNSADTFHSATGYRLISSIQDTALSVGLYSITATASGYSTNATSVNYETPGQVFTIYLTPGESLNATYYRPARIFDSDTGSLISSTLATALDVGDKVWYNRSSPSGNFNITGSGSDGLTPFASGDVIAYIGSSSGYGSKSDLATVSPSTNGQYIYIPLTSINNTPIAGQFMLVIQVMDTSSEAALPYAGVVVNGVTKTTNSFGVATFSNLTVGNDFSVSVSKNGYLSQSFTLVDLGVSGETIYEPVYLISDSVTPNGSYYLPVKIVDARTSSALGESILSSKIDAGDSIWYNRSSSSGIFNASGYGVNGLTPWAEDDVANLVGNAEGYQENQILVLVNADTSGITQTIPLLSDDYAPVSGEFAAIISPYDSDTTNPIASAAVVVKLGSNVTSTKTTSSAGVATFTNLTAGSVYSATLSKSGYSSVTRTFSGGSGAVITVDISMSAVTVTPTTIATVTATTTGNGTYGSGSEGAADMLEDHAADIVGLFIFAIFLLVGAMIARAWKVI